MKAVRIALRIIGAIVVVLVLVVGGAMLAGAWRLSRRETRPVPAIAASTDPAVIERGRYLALTRCTGCHSHNDSLPLSGGPGFTLGPLGSLARPNLTPGGILREWSDGEIARAIREGVDRDGRSLVLMPSPEFHRMSDVDVVALLSFLRSQPADSRPSEPRHLKPLGYLLIGAHMFPVSRQPPITAPVPAIAPSAGVEYGRYAATMSGCAGCHGAALHGGQPCKPDVVAVAKQHPLAAFDGAVRRGQAVEGRPLSDEMPWKSFSHLSDQDLQAIYAFAKGLP
jgi:mono/diheme cytochrome c family protein